MSNLPSPQKDRFVHVRLPAKDQWPKLLPLEHHSQSGLFNCTSLLLDRNIENGNGARLAMRSETVSWTYDELHRQVCQIANVFTQYFKIEPGNRVLVYGANSPRVGAIWLAIQKIGAVVVTVSSMLRAGELQTLIDISMPKLVLFDRVIETEIITAVTTSTAECDTLGYSSRGDELEHLMNKVPTTYATCPTLADDVSIIAFTSGTTGQPKATVHFHRDIIAICETICRHIVKPTPDDVFISTSPLAFTFGLGGLLVFPLYAGACSVLIGRYSPEQLLAAIEHYGATVCFTVPTFYQKMAKLADVKALSQLRLAVSSGEALPGQVRNLLETKTGINLAEVLGSTEMLHAFAGSTGDAVKPGFIGPAIPGYKLAILDENGNEMPAGQVGRLAVAGPTGCRYMDDPRQSDYVQHGWNITGDACWMDEDGYISFHTRYDDMIISAGYNISGLEIENVLLEHPLVAECAVVGVPDNERGQIVAAYIVPVNDTTVDEQLTRQLQTYVKEAIAPYKYPRMIEYVATLPQTQTGKIQRFRLRSQNRKNSL